MTIFLDDLVTARGKIDARDGISDISLAASGTAVNEQTVPSRRLRRKS